VPVDLDSPALGAGPALCRAASSASEFPERLSTFRKDRGLPQQALADAVGIHVTQLRRYEAGPSQPILDVLRKLSVALRVSADALLFGDDQRGPDEELRLQFEAVSRLQPEDKEVVKSVLEGILIKDQVRKVEALR